VGDAAACTPEEALDQVWAGLRDYYQLMEYLGAFGDEWREEIRPRDRAAQDLAEVLPIIEELVLRFQDCHTRLHWPGKPHPTRPGVRLGWVEGGLAVVSADPATGLALGDRVLAIDGADAAAAMRAALPHSQGADPDAHAQSACAWLASGPPGTVLRLRTERGEVALARPAAASARPGGPPPRPHSFSGVASGDVGILRIRAWGGDGFLQQLDLLIEEARGLPHLLLDVRGNGGGDDGLACAGRFVERRFLCSIALRRAPRTDLYRREVAYCEPCGPWRYTGHVAVLGDAGCHSACVHFIAAMAASGVTCVVGMPTDGGGFRRRIDLACGATLIVSRMFPIDGGVAGIPLPLHGTAPHIRVPPTIADLTAGRDGPMEAALGWLRSGPPIPGRADLGREGPPSAGDP
jgi:carboxyl-terminal processing protease